MTRTINSREVARVTNQSNSSINRKIRKSIKYISMDAKLHASDYFLSSNYVDKENRQKKCFECTELGCELIANKLTGRKGTIFTAFYVKKFHQMKRALPHKTLMQLFSTPSGIQEIGASLVAYAKSKPKIAYYDTQMRNPGTMPISTISKDFGMSAYNLNNLLHTYRVIFKRGRTWYLYKKYQGRGYASYDKYSFGNNQYVKPQLKWTQRGAAFLHKLLNKHGYYTFSDRRKF